MSKKTAQTVEVAKSYGTMSMEMITSAFNAFFLQEKVPKKAIENVPAFVENYVRGPRITEEEDEPVKGKGKKAEKAEAKPAKGKKAKKDADDSEKVKIYILLGNSAIEHGVFPPEDAADEVESMLGTAEIVYKGTKIARKYAGFTFKQDKLEEVRECLEEKFEIDEVNCKTFEGPDWAEAEDKPAKGKAKAGKAKAGAKGKAGTKAKKEEVKLPVKKNKWGNLAIDNFVFVKVDDDLVCVGTQDEEEAVPKKKEDPLNTIHPLDEDDQKEISKLEKKLKVKIIVLTEKYLKKVDDEDMQKRLKNCMATSGSEEDKPDASAGTEEDKDAAEEDADAEEAEDST